MSLKTPQDLLEVIEPPAQQLNWVTRDNSVQLRRTLTEGWAWSSCVSSHDAEANLRTRNEALQDAVCCLNAAGIEVIDQRLQMVGWRTFAIKGTHLVLEGKQAYWSVTIADDIGLYRWWDKNKHLQDNLFSTTKRKALQSFYNIFVGTGKAMEYSWMQK